MSEEIGQGRNEKQLSPGQKLNTKVVREEIKNWCRRGWNKKQLLFGQENKNSSYFTFRNWQQLNSTTKTRTSTLLHYDTIWLYKTTTTKISGTTNKRPTIVNWHKENTTRRKYGNSTRWDFRDIWHFKTMILR